MMLTGADCTHETERRGKPETLVVTKRTSTTEYENMKLAFNVRFKEARIEISKLGQLTNVAELMKDQYETIVQITEFRRATAPAAAPAGGQQALGAGFR